MSDVIPFAAVGNDRPVRRDTSLRVMTGRSCRECNTLSSVAAPRPASLLSCRICFEQRDQSLRCVNGAGCGGDDTFEEEVEPRFPIAGGSNAIQQPVIFLAVLFEIQAQVKQGLLQDGGVVQQQRDQ